MLFLSSQKLFPKIVKPWKTFYVYKDFFNSQTGFENCLNDEQMQ